MRRKKEVVLGIFILVCAVLLGREISLKVSGKVSESIVVVDAGHGRE